MQKQSRSCAWLAVALLVAFAYATHSIAQQTYPNRAIRIIVPYTPGTGIDILARTIGQRLSEKLNVAVVVVDRPGESGHLGTRAAIKACPLDYHTCQTAV